MKKKVVFSIALFIASYVLLYSQNHVAPGWGVFQPPVNFPTPNAASLGVYGSTPVSYFTGIPEISIPIYKIECKGLSIPINLSYHPSNLKVDAHPGWVGLGWTLQAGGQIVRKVNGEIDEWRGQALKKGYFDEYANLARSDWNLGVTLKDYFAKYSFYFHPATHAIFDLMADEFNFNFLNYSGKFYFDHTGHWKVISDKFIKVIDVEYNTFHQLRENLWALNQDDLATRFILNFTLLTPDGVKYVFGGKYATEYSIPYRAQATAIPCPTTWNLTKIILPSGEQITFDYESNDPTNKVGSQDLHTYMNCSLEDYFNYEETASLGNVPINPSFLNPSCPMGTSFSATYNSRANGFLLFPVYLSKISFPNGRLEFSRSKSFEKRYPYPDMQIDNPVVNQPYYGSCPEDPESGQEQCGALSWYKLDKITLWYLDTDSDPKRQFDFVYSNTSSERLKLSTITESSFDNNHIKISKNPYVFGYNDSNKLPDYCSGNDDHWGFNTGRNIKSSPYFYAPGTYYAMREADQSGEATQYEILKSIIYPTDGYTKFVFEPNHYDKVVDEHRSLQNAGGDKIGCGLRIKSISDYSAAGKLSTKREYYYVRGYTAGVNPSSLPTSGILSGKIQYEYVNYMVRDEEDREYNQYVFSSYPKFPLGEASNGSNIGYSEVTELITDGTSNNSGYTKYKFTNFDQDEWGNSHPDQLGNNTSQEVAVYSPFYSRALERGKPTSVATFKADGTPVQTVYNKYTASGNDFVRLVKTSNAQLCGGLFGSMAFFGTGYGEFCYRYDNTWTQTVAYDNSGNPTISSEKYFGYDVSTGEMNEEKIIDSKDQEIITEMLYPNEISLGLYPVDPEAITNDIERAFNTNLCADSINSAAKIECNLYWWSQNTQYPSVCHDANGNFLRNECLNYYNNIIPPPDAEASGVIDLIQKNMISSPIQIIKKVNGKIVSADYNKFLTQNNFTLPRTSYKVEMSSPMLGLDVSIPYISDLGVYTKSGSFSNSNEQVYFDSYDDHGNIIQYRKKNDNPTSFVWGYNNSYPTAMAKNAFSNEIAYSSFDCSADNGNWNLGSASVIYVPRSSVNFPARGVGYLAWNSGTITLNNLDPLKKYKLRFYARTSGSAGIAITGNGTVPIISDNKWNFYEYTFQGSSSVSLTCTAALLLDELSLCPDNARMTTYTYDPVFGINSSTDENNISVYYEYDTFGRLSTIRDQYGNIVKQIDYKYRKPLTDKVQ